MIKIKICRKKNQIHSIAISGHSGYASSGYDIVCSAVSSVVTTTINGILSFAETIHTTDDGEVLEIVVLNNDKITKTLLVNMINLLQEIEKQYKKYIRMEENNEF